MSDNRQSLSDLAALANQAPPAAPTTDAAGGEAPAAAPAPVVSTMPLREQIIDKQGRAYRQPAARYRVNAAKSD